MTAKTSFTLTRAGPDSGAAKPDKIYKAQR